RLRTFKDLIYVRGQLSSCLTAARAVRDQATAVPIASDEQCRQPIPDCQFSDPASMLDGSGHFQDQYGLGLRPAGGLERAFQVRDRPSDPQGLRVETGRLRLPLI